jgi:hypothetical protein
MFARHAGGRFYRTLGWPHLVIGAGALIVLVVVISVVGRGARSDDPNQGLPLGTTDKARAPAVDAPRGTPPAAHRSTTGGRQPTPLPPPPPPTGENPRGEPPKPEPKAPPKDDSATPPGRQPERPAPPAAEPFELKPGQSYVVVQHVSRSATGQAAAQRIREFLTSRGVSCAVRPGGGDLEIIATEPFATRQTNVTAATQEKARAQQLIDQIRKLGQEFNISGGYSFDKCYLREPKK